MRAVPQWRSKDDRMQIAGIALRRPGEELFREPLRPEFSLVAVARPLVLDDALRLRVAEMVDGGVHFARYVRLRTRRTSKIDHADRHKRVVNCSVERSPEVLEMAAPRKRAIGVVRVLDCSGGGVGRPKLVRIDRERNIATQRSKRLKSGVAVILLAVPAPSHPLDAARIDEAPRLELEAVFGLRARHRRSRSVARLWRVEHYDVIDLLGDRAERPSEVLGAVVQGVVGADLHVASPSHCRQSPAPPHAGHVRRRAALRASLRRMIL